MKPKAAAALSVMLIAVLLALFTAGCSVGGKAVEYRDPSVPIVVEEGEEFAIVLESSPSTGQRWELGKELDAEVVTLEKVEFEEPAEESHGQPGEERWTFKAAGIGRTEIVLSRMRTVEVSPTTMGEGTLRGSEGAGEESVKEEGENSVNASTAKEGAHAGKGTEVEGEAEKAVESQELILPAPREAEESKLEEETLIFSVWVKEKGATDKEPKKYEDPAEAIEVKEGYRFAIVLESDPTAGRRWRLAEPLDEEKLSLVSTTFEAKGGGGAEEGEKVGAPGEETWTFEALRPGETEVAFVLWEGEKAGESVVFQVDIKEVGGKESTGH